MIELNDISKRYGELTVLSSTSITVEAGEALGLCGPTGCGKTTLLRIIAGLTEPTDGTVRIAGKLANAPVSKMSPSERRIGMVFQDLALWPHMSVRRHLEYALGATIQNRAARRDRAIQLIDRLHLTDHGDSRPSTMSRGQRQRLAIARALCNDFPTLLLDEPVSSQDSAMADRLRDLFIECRDVGKAVVVASHDRSFLKSLCNRILLFDRNTVQCIPVADFR